MFYIQSIAAWLNNLKVYVGSCRSDDAIEGSNNVCNANIGVVAQTTATNDWENQALLIEIDCVANAHGRYVYILPSSPATLLGFCEVRVFGSESKCNLLCILKITVFITICAHAQNKIHSGLLHPNFKLPCFVCYLKIIDTFLK